MATSLGNNANAAVAVAMVRNDNAASADTPMRGGGDSTEPTANMIRVRGCGSADTRDAY